MFYAIAIILTLLFLAISFIASGGYVVYVGYLLAIGLVIALGFAFYLGFQFNTSIETASNLVTDRSRYREVLSRFGPDSEVINHFPLNIPGDAQNVHLYFQKSFRGNFTFQLRMQLLPTQVAEIQNRFRLVANLQSMTTYDSHQVEMTYGKHRLYAGEIQGRDFPARYELLVLEDNRGGTYKPSHPYFYGVAIDSIGAEVVYWSERW